MTNQQSIDPVCGMTIVIEGAIAREHAGERYHFCSHICAHRFDADAMAYVAVARLGLEGWGKTEVPGFLWKDDPDAPSQ